MIGQRVVRIDGHEKVTGRALYGDDLQLPGMLHAAGRHTDIPAGKITRLDITAAAAMPGVRAIALYRDIPGQTRLGPIRPDQYVLVKDEVFYSGDVLAVVAAETRAQAQAAADRIAAEYEPFTPVTDVREAIKPDCRRVHREYESNQVLHYPLRRGNVEEGFAQSAHVIERTYETGFHEHAYIEPESLTVAPDPATGGYTIYGSVQNPYTTRRFVAQFMKLPLNRVVVKSSVLGGSFGGKDDQVSYLACRAALLCSMTNQPVKITLTREESIVESYKRHPYVMTYKVGFDAEGRLLAMKINILADSGAYSAQSFFVTWRSVVQATGPYVIPHVSTDITTVYTNNTYTSAFRGFGSPQVIFAQESLMDEIAALCGKTPMEIRLLNGYRQNSITASGQQLSGHTVSLHEVIQKAADEADYSARAAEYAARNAEGGRYRYGIGMACSFRGCSLGAEGTDTSCAILRVWPDGSITLGTAVHENGQGLATAMCMTAAEELGLPLERFTFMPSQTDAMPDGGPTVASRGTIVGGNAVIDAARRIKADLFRVAGEMLGAADPADTCWEKAAIRCRSTGKTISFDEAVQLAVRRGIPLEACGWFYGPKVGWEEATGQGDAYFTYVYGCQITDLRVDTHTGRIEVLRIVAAHDPGKAINRLGLEGQIYGGVAQGLGYGLFEDFNIQDGVVKAANFDEYLIPTVKDMPEIIPLIIENPDPLGPYGAKSIGEPTLELGAAAINNAFANATGRFNRNQPLTLEQVVLGKNLKKPSRAGDAAAECKHGGPAKSTGRISAIESFTPKNIGEALFRLSQQPAPVLLAGGTDVIIRLRRESAPKTVLNISALPELKGIRFDRGALVIGAGETISDILKNPLVREYAPLLCEAIRQIGSLQIRNRATLAGNLVNAAPCADSVPPLLACNATLRLQSASTERIVPAEAFIVKNYQSVIQPNELLTEIRVPLMDHSAYRYVFHKLGRRNALNITRISVCLLVRIRENQIEECRLSCGSLFHIPCRLPDIETLVTGKPLNDATIESISPCLDVLIEKAIGRRWSSEYKKPVFIHMAQDAFRAIQQPHKPENA